MKHFSFDLDGTLVDSIPLMEQSWQNVRSQLGVDVSWLEYKKNIGLSFSDICKNIGMADFEHEIQRVYFDFNLKNQHLICPMPGLDALKKKLLTVDSWSIITSKPQRTALPVLEKFGLEPDILITPDVLARGKPHPEASEIIRQKFDCSTFVYVGDTITDHLFAINSGFEFIRFLPPNGKMSPDSVAYKTIINPHKKVSDLSMI